MDYLSTCDPYFYPSVFSPTNAEPCTWLHYTQFAIVFSITVMVIGLLGIMACLIYSVAFRFKSTTNTKTKASFHFEYLSIMTAILTFGILILTLVLTFTSRRTIAHGRESVEVSKKAFNYTANGVKQMIAPLAPMRDLFHQFLEAEESASNYANKAETFGSVRILFEVGNIYNDAESYFRKKLFKIYSYGSLVLKADFLNRFNVKSYGDNIYQHIRQSNESTLELARCVRDVSSDLKSSVEEVKLRPLQTINNVQVMTNLFNDSSNQLSDLANGADQIAEKSKTAQLILLVVGLVSGFIILLVFLSYIFLSILGTKKRAFVQLGSCFSLVCIILFFALGSLSLGVIVLNGAYCKDRKEVLNPSRLDENFKMQNENFTNNLNFTYELLTCSHNDTLMDLQLRLHPEKFLNTFLDPLFEPSIGHAMSYLYPLRNHTVDMFDYMGLSQLNVASLNDDVIALDNLMENLNNSFVRDLVEPSQNESLYELDNNIRFSEMDDLIDQLNSITLQINVTFVRSNASSFGDKQIKDERFTREQKDELLRIYNSLHAQSVTYDEIVKLVIQVNTWSTMATNQLQYIIQNAIFSFDRDLDVTITALEMMAEDVANVIGTLQTMDIDPFLAITNNMTANMEFIKSNSRCEQIANHFNDMETSICHVVYPSAIIYTILLLLAGLILLCLYPVAVKLAEEKNLVNAETHSLLESRRGSYSVNVVYGHNMGGVEGQHMRIEDEIN
ncbi:enhancer of translation termination 1 [Acrasis kona]|uniref:Enhancer of translation termination 1 n=1 Tax=Acrasis kona TaxID=1008807 RepID=A0AAW2YXG3_9EUKA